MIILQKFISLLHYQLLFEFKSNKPKIGCTNIFHKSSEPLNVSNLIVNNCLNLNQIFKFFKMFKFTNYLVMGKVSIMVWWKKLTTMVVCQIPWYMDQSLYIKIYYIYIYI